MTRRSDRTNASRPRSPDAAVPSEPEWPNSDGLDEDGFGCTGDVNCEPLYEAMACPDEVDYIEHGLQALQNTSLSPGGRSATVRDLLGRMVTDLALPRSAFEAYLGRIWAICPEGFSVCAKQVFLSGQLSVAQGLFEEAFLRLASLVERHLQKELQLDRSEHLLMLNEAMQAWAQSRILQHTATGLSGAGCDIPFNLLRSAGRLRSQAATQQKVFLRLFRELRRAIET